MAYKDLHLEPFDKGTITKLEIFEDYAQAWIPTFVMQAMPEIHIFDFFSGPGYDSNNIPGSPIRLLEKINGFLGNLFQKKTKIVLHFNEFEPNKKIQNKFEKLKENCENYLEKNKKLKLFVSINYYNENSDELFFTLLPKIKKFPSLVYLDQNGVRFISEEYVNELEKLRTTDFLYFVSSSFFKRLGSTEEFRKVLEFDMEELRKEEYRNIHRIVLDKIKINLPNRTELKLFPFSIKKGANIYGIIFGAKHFRAVDKFLDISWKRNATNGEADFDIDEDAKKKQLDIFEVQRMTKVEKFKREVKALVLSGELRDNSGVLIHTYEAGHIPQHAADVLKELKKEGKIIFEGKTQGINYDNVFKKKNIVTYKVK